MRCSQPKKNYAAVHKDFHYRGSDYRLRKSGETASRYTLHQLASILELLERLDASLKSSAADKNNAAADNPVRDYAGGRWTFMSKLRIEEIIVVEGKYDAVKLSDLVDALIVPTKGFSILPVKRQSS